MPIHALTASDVVSRIVRSACDGDGGWVITPNLHHLRAFTRDDDLHRYFWAADLVVADGMPLLWASRLQGTPLPERVAGSDLTWTLAELLPRTACRCTSSVATRGRPERSEPPARREPGPACGRGQRRTDGVDRDEASLLDFARQIRDSGRGSCSSVSVPSPGADHRLLASRSRVGVVRRRRCLVQLVSGELKRAPRVLQLTGLEWSHRLWQEPRRLGRRYILQGVPFALELFLSTLLARLASRSSPRTP